MPKKKKKEKLSSEEKAIHFLRGEPIPGFDPEEVVEELKQKIDKNIEKHGKEYTEEEKKNYKKVLYKAAEGMPLKEAMEIDENVVKAIYGHGYKLFKSGKFKDANQVFRLLVMLDPLQSNYFYSLAASYHQMKEYKTAAEVYLAASFMDFSSPLPLFQAADCFLQQKQKEAAIFSLGGAITRCGDDEKYAHLKEKAKTIREKLLEETKKEEKK